MSRSSITWSLLIVSLIAVNAALAGQRIGTAKARGDYSPFGQTRPNVARYGRSYRWNAPVVQTAPAPSVAEAPAEIRRFSYDPSTGATSSDVDQSQAAAPVISEGGRFFNPPVKRGYSRGSIRSNMPAWALQKTDPQKYRVGR